MTKRKQQMSVKTRITNLKKLISDCVVLGFSPVLITGYELQLSTLQEEVKTDREHRMRLRK